jgi:hypothetical protein
MTRDIKKLKARLVACADRADSNLQTMKLASAFRERKRAQKIYEAMIRQGQQGVDACFEIAEGDNHNAAILCCTLAYDINPRRSIRALKRIDALRCSRFSDLARSMAKILKLGM